VLSEPEIENELKELFLVVLGRRLIMKLEVIISESRQHNGVREVLCCQDTEVLVNLQ